MGGLLRQMVMDSNPKLFVGKFCRWRVDKRFKVIDASGFQLNIPHSFL